MNYRNRRLHNEFENLSKSIYNKCELFIEKEKITIQSPMGRHICITFPVGYPFRPPFIFINHQQLRCFPIDSTLAKRFEDEFHQCPCCILNLSDSWSPSVTIKDLLDIIIQYETRWTHIVQKYIQEFIHMPDDVTYIISKFL